MKQLSFFNTIHLSGNNLAEATGQALKQDERVLQILKAGAMTPIQVSKVYNQLYPEAPLTSIRRSMTVLTKKGFLEKCFEMKQEKYGKENHLWRVKNVN